jgi:excisionase family DNA binding protein
MTPTDRRRRAASTAPASQPAGPDDAPAQDKLLTVPDVARLLQLSERTIRRLIAAGALDVVRIGRSVRIRRNDLSSLLSR